MSSGKHGWREYIHVSIIVLDTQRISGEKSKELEMGDAPVWHIQEQVAPAAPDVALREKTGGK
jgi:hypothetical protein